MATTGCTLKVWCHARDFGFDELIAQGDGVHLRFRCGNCGSQLTLTLSMRPAWPLL
jgi:hypothetical protein